MTENIMNFIKGAVANAVSNNNEVPEHEKTKVTETTTDALTNGLSQNLNLDNLSGITSLFGGNSSNTMADNPIIGNIKNVVVNALIQKTGLSQGIAGGLASSLVPAVINSLIGKAKDPNDTGFNLQSLVSSFTNKSNNKNNDDNGLLGALSKFF